MFLIVGCHNGLSVGSFDEPAFLDPFRLKVGRDTFEMRQELRHDLFFAHGEECIVHGTIVAEVEQVLAAIFGW